MRGPIAESRELQTCWEHGSHPVSRNERNGTAPVLAAFHGTAAIANLLGAWASLLPLSGAGKLLCFAKPNGMVVSELHKVY